MVVDTIPILEQRDDLDLKRLVGRVIARQRASAEVSQEKLAEMAGLERGYISLMERGLRMPTVDTIFRLCRGLKVSPSEMVLEMEKQVEVESKASKKIWIL
jgi:transcriptional regulator with XRE-family HTH domain